MIKDELLKLVENYSNAITARPAPVSPAASDRVRFPWELSKFKGFSKKFISFDYLEKNYSPAYRRPPGYSPDANELKYGMTPYKQTLLDNFLASFTEYNDQPESIKVTIGLILSLYSVFTPMTLIRPTSQSENNHFILSVPSSSFQLFRGILSDISSFILSDVPGGADIHPIRASLPSSAGHEEGSTALAPLFSICVLPVSFYDISFAAFRDPGETAFHETFKAHRNRRAPT